MITWLQYYKLKLLHFLFHRCKNGCSIAHAFLSNKNNQSRAKLWLANLLKFLLPQNSNKLRYSQISGFCITLNTLGEVNFQSKLRLKKQHQLINFFHLRIVNKARKRSSKVMGTFRKFLEWGAETFSDWSLKHAHNFGSGCHRH